jgi:hypothetical protein
MKFASVQSELACTQANYKVPRTCNFLAAKGLVIYRPTPAYLSRLISDDDPLQNQDLFGSFRRDGRRAFPRNSRGWGWKRN